MGLFDVFFKNSPKPVGQYQGRWKMLSGYEPRFTRYTGSIYERELIRASINARAVHISKLKVEMIGSAKPALRAQLMKNPNQLQTWSQFLYRLSTILDVHNTAYIVPVYDIFGEISGIFCPVPSEADVVKYDEVPYLRYKFGDGRTLAVELEYCGVMTKFQYKDDLMGESNNALMPTLDLIHIQDQGINEATKSSATYRFWARLTNFTKDNDLKNERKRFSDTNFGSGADGGGMLLFPNTYSDIHQIEQKPWVINAEQMALIRNNVFEYFMVNEDILQNKAFGDAWNAFYEGCIEQFAIQFSEVMTKMLFTFREQGAGNLIMATANRLQYMSNSDKLKVSESMADRGIMNRNEIREIWNLPPIPGGDVYIIRGEYYSTDEKLNSLESEGESDEEGN